MLSRANTYMYAFNHLGPFNSGPQLGASSTMLREIVDDYDRTATVLGLFLQHQCNDSCRTMWLDFGCATGIRVRAAWG